MADITLSTVQFQVDKGTVAMLVIDPFGGQHFLNSTEPQVSRWLTEEGKEWGNAEVLLEGQHQLDLHEVLGGKGHRLVMPPPPAQPQLQPGVTQLRLVDPTTPPLVREAPAPDVPAAEEGAPAVTPAPAPS